jgi:hypothetical protein
MKKSFSLSVSLMKQFKTFSHDNNLVLMLKIRFWIQISCHHIIFKTRVCSVACLFYNLPFLLCHLTSQKAMSLDNLCALHRILMTSVVVTYSITVPNVSQHDAVSFNCLQHKNSFHQSLWPEEIKQSTWALPVSTNSSTCKAHGFALCGISGFGTVVQVFDFFGCYTA